MNHIANRSLIVDALCEELVGPSPQGRAISCAGHVSFSSNEAFYGPWRQENGEEILQRDPPIVRYGVGVLYPMKSEFEKEETAPEEGAPVVDEGRDITTDKFVQEVEAIEKRAGQNAEPEGDDLELPTANAVQP
ncbi:MAG: hypothetical protein M3498_10600, partial [Deinococcota bacterium]|nr:hypothetical protein [Deinococcota bacterium]